MGQVMIGESIKRREDPKYIMGTASYVDDISLPGMLYAAFVRSPHAYAKILSIDIKRVLEHPKGVESVTGADAAKLAKPMPVYSYREAVAIKKPEYRCLANDRVRFVGEPVAVVAARDRYWAEDVAELITVEYEPLEPVMDPEASLQPNAPKLHDYLDNNIGLSITREGGDLAGAFLDADFVFKKRFRMHRHTGTPIETRGCIAQYNPGTGDLTLICSTQVPHILKSHLAEILSFSELHIRVIAPDVGGGFGNKLQVPPEYVAICLLAMKTRRPVKWIETRRESLMAFIHARDQIHDVEVPMKRDGTILGIKAQIIVDAGGYLDARISGPSLGAGMWLPGPYKMRGYSVDINVVMTNKCPYGAYRGFGSQMGALVIERAVDLIARDLNVDPAELRRKNLIQSLPYKTVTGHEFDSGDYFAALDKALDLVGYKALRSEQKRLRKEGRHLGIGVAMAVEGAGWNTYTAAMAQYYVPTLDYATVTMRMDTSGNTKVLIGDSACGTGHATTAAQVAADSLGIPIDNIEVVEGDTAVTPYDSGTRAARFSAIVLPAVAKTGKSLKEKIIRVAAHIMEASESDVDLTEGNAYVKGSPNKNLPVSRVARVAYSEVATLPRDMPAGLEATESFKAPVSGLCITWPYAVHVPVVEVDIKTGTVKFLKYVIVHDCGVEVNPRIVEGQVAGGTAQGIGGTLLEELVYDENGQLLTTSFMDYLIPTATDIPRFEVFHMQTAAPQIPGGYKGMGEGGCVYTYAAVVNAVADAIEHLGVEITSTPLSPSNVLKLLRQATKSASRSEVSV
jgi:carbon-monoxide dehydrogenase large subunit